MTIRNERGNSPADPDTGHGAVYNEEALKKRYEDLLRLFRQVETAKQEWEKSMDCVADIVILVDKDRNIKRCNKALVELTKKTYSGLLGRNWIETLLSHGIKAPAWYGKGVEALHGPTNRWFVLDTYPAADLKIADAVVAVLHDTTALRLLTQKLTETNKELAHAYEELKATQSRILQQEKMASIGQLAAGVAHEINSPVGFVTSNLGTLRKYMGRIAEFLAVQTEIVLGCASSEAAGGLMEKRKRLKIDFIMSDAEKLISESLDGAERVKTIVQNLKSFSRVDQAEVKAADINECIEISLNIVWNELKYKAHVKKEYGALPITKCIPQQLNQVFMNLLLNAGQALEKEGEITIQTWATDGSIFVSISDTGCGIPEENLNRIFEPLFTTKPVGKGTGLGLSITYDIIKKHKGDIFVSSRPGKGTTFTIRLPVVGGE